MLHDVVDIPYWKSIFSLEKLRSELHGLHPNMQLGGMRITSPYHIAVVEQLREESLAGEEQGKKIPTDIFIWNLGEPTRREITKIGGLPYRPRSNSWPSAESGQPMTFIGQICFVDSKDVVGSLPGDILLIFAESDEYGIKWDDNGNVNFIFEWVSVGSFPLIEESDIPQLTWSPLRMYGSILRVYDYPECGDCFSTYNDHELLSILEATKIGGIPFWVQDNAELPGRFLFSIASIEPAISGKYQGIKIKQYPYVNRAEPIDFKEWQDSNTLIWGDMGMLYIYLDADGKISWSVQSH